MPDGARDELAALRAANARLRGVIEAKDIEIAALRSSHQAQLDALRAQVAALATEVAELRARVGQNARNSSKPPSSEGLARPVPGSLRKKSGRGPGRPKGQPGATLEMTGRPDAVQAHEPGRCAGCGAVLPGAPVTKVERRQMTDLPEDIRARVTEHRIISPPVPVRHGESGFRVGGALAWVHSASSGKYALITVHPKRGREAMDAAGVLPAFGGIAVHDAWAPCDGYDGVAGHALCNAHALRELQAVMDAAPPGQWCWAGQAADAQRSMKRLADAPLVIDATLDHLGQGKLAAARHRYHSALLIGKRQTAARASPPMRKHHALARRLLEREDDYLRYTNDGRVPFDNYADAAVMPMFAVRGGSAAGQGVLSPHSAG